MSPKVVLVLCAQALLVQSVISQCTSRAAIEASGLGLGAPFGLVGPGLAPALAGPGLAYNGLAAPGLAFDGLAAGYAGRGLPYDGLYAPAMEFTATSGGALPVTSSSAIAPTGISIVSENAIEGILSIVGDLPFVGTTGMEGAMPSAGAGAINHGCGNGVTAMASDAAAYVPGAAISPIAATFGPAASIAPVSATFGPAPLAGRIGLGGCGGNIIY